MTASLVDRLRALPSKDRARILGSLTWRERARLRWEWRSFWLRPDTREPGAMIGSGQVRPVGGEIFWVNQGGRGSGKSQAAAVDFTDDAHALGPGFAGAIVASTVDEARKLVEDSLLAVSPPHYRVRWEPTVFDGLVTWGSGAFAYVYSADKPAKARGGNFNRLWADDLPKFGPRGAEHFHTLLKAFRLQGHGLRAVITATPPDPGSPPSCPELLEWILDKQHDPSAVGLWVFSLSSSDDNLSNLDDDYKRVLAMYAGGASEEAERHGIYVKDGATRVFREVDFSCAPVRARACPEMFDVLTISIDPADSSNTKACEVGIVAAGLSLAGASAFVLEDASDKLGSDDWPERAWALAERWAPRARRWRFVIEVNRGTKDSTLLRNAEIIRRLKRGQPGISVCEIRTVTSREDKGARAAPLPMLYRNGQVHHVNQAGELDAVEKQMRGLTNTGTGSTRLDRADALVYALLDLFGLLDGQHATALGTMPVHAAVFGGGAQGSLVVASSRDVGGLTMQAPGQIGPGVFGGGRGRF